MLAFSDQPSAISDNSTQSQIGDRKSAILKILDLGLALLAGEPVAAQRDLTGTGQLVGTFDYMAPEQGSDSHQVDIRADIYSLGATLYKLLCGESPFPASKYNTPAKMLTALATVAPPSIADKRDDLPPELIAIVVRMLAKNPGDRFATPAEVADALAPFAAESDLSALLQLATIKTTGTPSVDQSKTPTDAFLSRPSTGTEVTLDQVTKMLDKQSSSGSSDLPARASGSPPRSRNRSIAAAFGGIVLLGIVTLIFQTSGGTMIVEIDDPEGLIQVTVEGQDVLITDKHKNGEPIKLRPDDYKLHVTRGDLEFTTDNFTLKRGDTVVLHVTATVRQVQVVQDEKVIGRGEVGANSIDDPDRRASLIALNAGGQVVIQVEGASSAVTVALRDELPDQAFKLGSVYFRSTARIITKEEFDRFCEALKTTGHNSMWEFALYGPHVTDDWLVNLHGMTINLIDLWGTSVSDMGIEHLREIKDLKSLSFARAEISDQGVRTLAGIETVTSLDLSDTNVTDVGLRTLRALDLLLLDLSGTQATNEGLAYVAVHGRLKHLRLASCDQISDDGMRYLSTMQELENIDIAGTPITDDGLLHLAGLTNLHAIAFPSNEKITEAGLAVLDNFPHLTHLNLFGVKIGGPTVARIAKLSTLDNLDIGWPTMIDADLVELSTLRQISYLDLRNSSVTDAGIAHLETMPQLRYVDLAGAKVTLEGVAKLKRALPECQITSDFTDEQIAAAMEVLKKVQK
jgi:hypothetical protein